MVRPAISRRLALPGLDRSVCTPGFCLSLQTDHPWAVVVHHPAADHIPGVYRHLQQYRPSTTDGLPQYLFYLSGNVMWGYFSTCLTGTSDTFIANAGIFGKVYFPRLVMPLSIIISNLLSFAIQFVFFLGFYLFFYLQGAAINLTEWAFTLPLLILLMAGLGLGFGIIISSMTTKYRDLRYLVTFGVSLWMYATLSSIRSLLSLKNGVG
jgi:hypothetical protein